MESGKDLLSIVKDISEHPVKYIDMGKKAKEFYDSNRTPIHVAQGFWDAILYVTHKK